MHEAVAKCAYSGRLEDYQIHDAQDNPDEQAQTPIFLRSDRASGKTAQNKDRNIGDISHNPTYFGTVAKYIFSSIPRKARLLYLFYEPIFSRKKF